MLPALPPATATALRTAPTGRGEPEPAFRASRDGGEPVELLAVAHDRPVGELVTAALPAVRELVRHGLLVPVAGR